MKQTINGILLFVEELFGLEDGFFLMTRNLNQDKLENAFSVLRQRGGSNSNPSVFELNNILCRLMAARIVKMSSKTNCEDINDTVIDDLSNILANETLEETAGELNEEHEQNIHEKNAEKENVHFTTKNFIDDFSLVEEMTGDIVSLRYFLGFITYKMMPFINCDICSESIRKTDEVMTAPSELFLFNKNYKSLTDFGSLIAPSDNFMKVGQIFVQIFEKVFSTEPQKLGIRKYVKNKCMEAYPEWFSICRHHKEQILDYFLLILIRKNCIWMSQNKNCTKNKRKLKILNS